MDEAKVLRTLEDLRRLRGTWVADPAREREIDRVEAFTGVHLPPAHRAFLLAANGATTGYGYQRLFGVGDGSQDIGPWNAHETWKFAWPIPLDDFLSIGQTGWGDQFAYKLADLRRGIESIHRFDYFMLEKAETPVAGTFVTFLHAFLMHACMPDEKVNEARRQLGDLDRDELAVFSPSPLLVGLERATQLRRMNARDAMILNGDLTTQLVDPEHETRRVSHFDQYLDDLGRQRVRVHWTPRLPAQRDTVDAAEPSTEPQSDPDPEPEPACDREPPGAAAPSAVAPEPVAPEPETADASFVDPELPWV